MSVQGRRLCGGCLGPRLSLPSSGSSERGGVASAQPVFLSWVSGAVLGTEAVVKYMSSKRG